MCGIWFLLNPHYDLHPPLLSPFFSSLASRGPDDHQLVQPTPHSLLSFHRLAINDLSPRSMQPFSLSISPTRTLYLVCNGEIYNYKDLATTFSLPLPSSDCSILLPLFRHFGCDINLLCRHLRGEYALVILSVDSSPYEIQNQPKIQGWAARDPFGVRPLFFGRGSKKEENHQIIFSSLLSGIRGVPGFLPENVSQFPPGHSLSFSSSSQSTEPKPFYTFQSLGSSSSTSLIKRDIPDDVPDLPNLYHDICDRFIYAIRRRIHTRDRSIGALLSGGLDSSLVVAIAYKILGVTDLRVFSIGLESKDSSDLLYAQKVADHLGLPPNQYTQFLIDSHTAIESVPSVIEACETYDITTIRASVMQYHLARLISENTDIRILLNGDGADELAMGYLYFHYAPEVREEKGGCNHEDENNNLKMIKEENLKLLREIHYFDGLRVDRNLGNFGMEARVPFLDQDFVDFYLSIPYSLKIPGKGRRFPQEKGLLRRAFHHVYPDLLPQEVLFRKKEAFSDGVSSTHDSWYTTLSNHYSELSKKIKIVADNKMTSNITKKIPHRTDEASFYLETFQQRFKGYEHIIPHYWMPAFVDREIVQDPSARTLGVYLEEEGTDRRVST